LRIAPSESGASLSRNSWSEIPAAGHTAQEVINRATVNNDFHIALLNVAASKSGGNVVSNKRLGWWLKNVEGKIVHLVDEQDSLDLVLKKEGTVAGYSKWQLHNAIELKKS
jgi:hypothetical protein